MFHSFNVRTFCARNPLFERAGPRLELNALGAVSACVPAATAPGPTRNNGGCLTGGGSLGGTGIPPPTFFIVSESGHLSCDADHKKSLLSDNSCGSVTISDGMPRSLSCPRDVRFTPKSRHRRARSSSGHRTSLTPSRRLFPPKMRRAAMRFPQSDFQRHV